MNEIRKFQPAWIFLCGFTLLLVAFPIHLESFSPHEDLERLLTSSPHIGLLFFQKIKICSFDASRTPDSRFFIRLCLKKIEPIPCTPTIGTTINQKQEAGKTGKIDFFAYEPGTK